jgi:hypothetical protein
VGSALDCEGCSFIQHKENAAWSAFFFVPILIQVSQND